MEALSFQAPHIMFYSCRKARCKRYPSGDYPHFRTTRYSIGLRDTVSRAEAFSFIFFSFSSELGQRSTWTFGLFIHTGWIITDLRDF